MIKTLKRGEQMQGLIKKRKERKLTQKQLAEMVGVKQHTVCGWENGNRQPNFEKLKKLSKIFKCNIDDLL